MGNKERYQNPAIGDTVNLRLFTYNSNNLANLQSIVNVETFYLDRTFISKENPDGRRLIETFDGSVVQTLDTGSYLLPVYLEPKKYVIGNNIDIWTVTIADDQPNNQIANVFQIFPALWYTTPIPVVYDFHFHFQPNKLRRGSKQFLIIEIIPSVPTAGDLRQYYENIAIVSDLLISIEQECGDCLPKERDERLLVDRQLVDFREKRHGYYQLDTSEMDCGIYNIWFELNFGSNIYISDKFNFQVYQ